MLAEKAHQSHRQPRRRHDRPASLASLATAATAAPARFGLHRVASPHVAAASSDRLPTSGLRRRASCEICASPSVNRLRPRCQTTRSRPKEDPAEQRSHGFHKPEPAATGRRSRTAGRSPGAAEIGVAGCVHAKIPGAWAGRHALPRAARQGRGERRGRGARVSHVRASGHEGAALQQAEGALSRTGYRRPPRAQRVLECSCTS